MNIRWMALLGIVLLAGTAAAQNQQTLTDSKAKISYALGMDLGTQLKKQSVDIDPDIFFQGLKAALSGTNTLLTPEQAQAAITELQNQLRQKMAEAAKVLAEKNKKEGEAFLAANKAKEGVVTLPSGLQYKILKAAEGPKPTADDTVVCQYRGTFVDGTEFDNSYKRPEPATFAVKGVIKGWTEALQMMPVGSKWQLFVPSDLAYGEAGRNPIGPNAVLIFEVELLSVKGK